VILHRGSGECDVAGRSREREEEEKEDKEEEEEEEDSSLPRAGTRGESAEREGKLPRQGRRVVQSSADFRCPLAREPRELADALARPSRRTSEREIPADPPHVGSRVAVPELGAL